MKWKRRPYEVEAIKFTGDNLKEVNDFISPGKVIATGEKDLYTILLGPGPGEIFWKGDFVVKMPTGYIKAYRDFSFLYRYERVD